MRYEAHSHVQLNTSIASGHESHSQRRRSMEEEEEDRLSSLPDDLLHSILRDLPLKEAVRTSALSRRWAPQWTRALAASLVLDLADNPGLAVATVDRCLRLHAERGTPLEVFRVALASPPTGLAAMGRDIVGWVAAAVARGAREVKVEVHLVPPPSLQEEEDACFVLELPGDLFQQARNSLERLALGRLSLKAVPLPAPGLASLRSLSLTHADITGGEVEDVLANCRALEFLSLRSCYLLAWASVASERLRVLELVGCWAVEHLRVDAPALESFTFYGHTSSWGGPVVFFDMGATTVPALRDAYLSHLDRDHAIDIAHDITYPNFYTVVAHARILTLCSTGWVILREYTCEQDLPRGGIDMPNLEELQLLVGPKHHEEALEYVSIFFMAISLPVLQRLFVRLPSWDDDDPAKAWTGENDDDEAQDNMIGGENEMIVLDRLVFIKIVNFRGARNDLRLLRFFLERAPILQHLVLVTVEGDEQLLEAVQERVSVVLHKAPREARISVCRPSGDDSPNHAHNRFFHEEHALQQAYN